MIISRIRERLTYANIAMTLALVLAMSGGAYAAKHYVINSIKQINPKVVKQLKGQGGQAGERGPQGPPGEKGQNGANGANGAVGVNGESVSSAVLGKGDKTCPEGGSKFTVGGKETSACNGKEGKDGSPWTAGGTLPSGKTETGTYAVFWSDKKINEIVTVPVSFPIPLAPPIAPKEYEMRFNQLPPAADEPGCKGSVEKPEAEPGNLCVFEGAMGLHHMGGLNHAENLNTSGGAALGTTGDVLIFTTHEPGTVGEEVSAEGSWAVTAE